MRVDLEAETHLFEDGVGLVALGFLSLLRGFVLELTEVHDLRDRRLGVGSNLNQIQVGLLGKAKSILDADDSNLLALGANETYFRDADSVIRSGIADAFLLVVIFNWPRLRQVPKSPTREKFVLTLVMCQHSTLDYRDTHFVHIGGVPTTR